MKNLGDSARTDEERATRNGHILAELLAAGIAVNVDDRGNACGALGPFMFCRCWYYWSVSGRDIPLDVAREMYDHPDGRADVRVNGDCGAPAPTKDVRAYHIDSTAGLKLFVDTLRKHGLVPA